MGSADLKLKTQLIFWQIFETGLIYNSLLNINNEKSINSILKANGYDLLDQDDDDIPDYYHRHVHYKNYLFEDSHELDTPEKVNWLAETAKQYMPICFEVHNGKFESIGGLYGTIYIEAHIHYGGAILFDSKLLFGGMHTVSNYCNGSDPSKIRLTELGLSLWDYMMKMKSDIVELLKNNNVPSLERKINIKLEDIVHPWHHNWIILGHELVSEDEFDQGRWQQDFLKGNKYYLHALGLTQRMNDWQTMSTDFFDYKNKSPYVNSAIYLTNAGNVIVPNFELLDHLSFKNKLADILFACEMGNVQRFLFLIHVNYISKRVVILQEDLEAIKTGDLKADVFVSTILELEEDMNRDVLTITDDLMPARVRRIMFSSILKLDLFKEMIEQLHGFEYENRLNNMLDQMQKTLVQAREIITIRSDQVENKILNNLQLVFIITLATELISLFFYDVSEVSTSFGLQLLIVANILAVVLFGFILGYSKFKK